MKDDRVYLRHILRCIARIDEYVAGGPGTFASSHLVQEGVRWTDSIPYLKDSTSQLSVWAGGNLTLNAAVRELHVQASLTSGKEISVSGAGKSAVIAGGLQAGAFELGSNRMTIVPDVRALSPERISEDAPRTAVPLLFVLALRPIQWSE